MDLFTRKRKGWKRLTYGVNLFLFTILLQGSTAYADTTAAQYLKQMKTTYGFKLSIVDKMDWLIVIIISIASILCLVAFCYLLGHVIYRVMHILQGKKELDDWPYWRNILISFLLLFAFMSGIFVAILEKFYGGFSAL
jgi:hypothetical protein